MESEYKINKQPNDREDANIFSKISFAYTFPTFRKGFRRDLQEEDLTQHRKSQDSKTLGDRLELGWKNEVKLHGKPSLWRVLRKIFGLELVLHGVFMIFIELLLPLSQPIALSQLIKYYTQGETGTISEREAYIYASIIVIEPFLTVIFIQTWLLYLMQYGMNCRIALSSLIYRKTLRLSKSALNVTTIGEIVNLLSNDVSRCNRFVMDVHGLWFGPFEIIIIVGIMSWYIGITSTIGIGFMALQIPLQMYLGKKTSEFRLKTALKTDERIRLMNEIISGIQVIKMYTWEKPFANLIALVRRLEIRQIRAASYIKGIIISFEVFTTKFSVFLTILFYILLGNVLSAEYVFVVSSFYNIIKFAMTVHFPLGIAQLAEFSVSVSRLQKFLLYDEILTEFQTKETNQIDKKIKVATNGDQRKINCNSGVKLDNATARWSLDSSENTLEGINFETTDGELIAIIGPVGSGKSSLLHAILKELPISSGKIKVEGTISYASQEPWVFPSTIKQNILFGQPLKLERYYDVIKVCSLEQDLALFPYGDETIVGEKGVTLSGGQRARVSLARAVYKEADIYLLDDPLSAVDTHVGKHLFKNCICNFLKYKCTILVTHQLQYLENLKSIYLLENGKITAHNTYQELKNSGIDFTKQFSKKEEETESDYIYIEKPTGVINSKLKGEKPSQVKEQISLGSVSNDIYKSYFKAAGSITTSLCILFFFILLQLSSTGTDYFLTYWVNLEQRKSEHNSTETFPELSENACLYIYSFISGFMVVITVVSTYTYFKYSMQASKKLHDNMFSNIVKAPMRFFDTNSSGRILNRFSKDIGSIDEQLPMVAYDFLQLGLTVISISILVSMVNPWLSLVTAIMIPVFCCLRVVYMRTSRSFKRLEGTTRSPVFTHMTATLQGLTTIRSAGVQAVLINEFDNHQNRHTSASHWFMSCSRAFGFWLDLICAIYIAIVTFSFLLFNNEQYGGNVGLAVTQAMGLMGVFQWLMRQWTELENQMTSVERVAEYTDLDQEFNPKEKTTIPSWPEKGSISFVSVSLRYSSEDPYVLNKLNFYIKPRAKIGIVGRTGAGKSSIICALFQLSKTEGTIIIDDVDVTKISLYSLRSKISIIPQVPVLFSGNVRRNLDPFEEYPDEDLWKALEEVELKKVVSDLTGGLNGEVSEGGSNFSIGQKQLFCLARAIVRKNKILILDEATANVDPQTDTLIQQTIRKKFENCTVLTIAHRLHTVMDSDKVLVMDQGSVVEFEHPYLLLKNTNGFLYGLVQQTGPAMAETLAHISKQSYENTNIW